jgi:hypothetical protein
MLLPFDWLFENQHEIVPVLIEKNEDELEQSDILQQWHNVANDYIFSISKPDVEELTVKRRWIGTPYRPPKGTPLIDEPGR